MGKYFKALLTLWVWLLLLNTGAGVLQGVLLAPMLGDIGASWAAAALEMLVMLLLVALFFHKLANELGWFRLGLASLVWVGLTLAVDMAHGHYVLDATWDALTQRYNPLQGRADAFRLLVLALSPFLLGAQWVRRDSDAPETANQGMLDQSTVGHPGDFILPEGAETDEDAQAANDTQGTDAHGEKDDTKMF